MQRANKNGRPLINDFYDSSSIGLIVVGDSCLPLTLNNISQWCRVISAFSCQIVGCEAQLLSGQDCDLKYQPMAVFFPVFTTVTALATSIPNVQAMQCVDCQPTN
ncbi:Ras-related protein Rab-1A [Trichinella spiralis]|uniref:Ras-related protein Rab-1A n=1 Tax=Trichinella spiralis TaxID=6334 RepID=UPI0001EFBA16|nr:Ras-related protein Rab-1A [Trichinella spiralis]